MNLWEHWEHWLEIFKVNLAHSLRNTTMWTQLTSTHLVSLAMNLALMWFMRHHLPAVNSSVLLQRGGKSGLLSNEPIFPQPPCLSQQHKHSEEPEVHASGACLLQVQSMQISWLLSTAVIHCMLACGSHHTAVACVRACLPVRTVPGPINGAVDGGWERANLLASNRPTMASMRYAMLSLSIYYWKHHFILFCDLFSQELNNHVILQGSSKFDYFISNNIIIIPPMCCWNSSIWAHCLSSVCSSSSIQSLWRRRLQQWH